MDNILSVRERDELRGIGLRDMDFAWRVAKITYGAYKRNIKTGAKLYDYQIYAAVANECGYSSGKVEQLAKLHLLFPEETRSPDYLLGHYRVAGSFSDDRFEVLEYIEFYRGEYGKLPAASNLSYLYRKHVRGEYVDVEPIRFEGHDLVPAECAQENPFDRPAYNPLSALSGLVRGVRSFMASTKLPYEEEDKLSRALALIEEVFAVSF